ncbi:MAG: T9SS type A sorting domain-containing protein [Ignavibacteria bacterium]|nr:T9SS type A sorting domain-containing protein [Ignavibacteria bacterium]
MKTFNTFLLFAIFAFTNIQIQSQVTQQWAQRFTSDSVRNDGVNDMFVDAQGNVYVTGSQRQTTNTNIQSVTVKYNSQGVQQWIQNYIAPNDNGALTRAIHVDAAGNVYVTGESDIVSGGANKMLVIKYDAGGTQLWSYRFSYSSAYNGGYDIVSDLTGNVYVTGEYLSGTQNNISIVKFSSSGALIGQTFYNYDSEGGRRIALDGAGKIIVGGYCNINQPDSARFVVLKYEQNLDFVWASRCGSRGTGSPASPFDMTVDINSNVLLTGINNIDYAVFKINPDGTLAWNKFYNYASDIPRAIVTDNSGNVYVTGESGAAGLPLSYSITTIKYDGAGNQQWIRNYNGGSVPDGYAGYDIAVDNNNGVYVIGNVYGSSNIATVKYNTNGSLQWARIYNGLSSNSTDLAISVGVDQYGNVYTTGNSNSNNNTTGNDIAIIKYVPAAVFTNEFTKSGLTKTIVDLQSAYDTISVDYTAPANYYVYDVNLKIDTVLHPNDGDLEFYLVHNGITDTVIYQVGGSGDNFINTVLNDSASSTISGGTAPFTGSFKPSKVLSTFNNSNINGTWILKIYDRASGSTGTLKAWSLNFVIGLNPLGIQTVNSEVPGSFSLSQNYPNPFNPTTNIRFTVPQTGFVKLSVFDMLGREVETLVNENLNAGTYNADWNASNYSSGVYFYKIQAGNFSEIKKMILIK